MTTKNDKFTTKDLDKKIEEILKKNVYITYSKDLVSQLKSLFKKKMIEIIGNSYKESDDLSMYLVGQNDLRTSMKQKLEDI